MAQVVMDPLSRWVAAAAVALVATAGCRGNQYAPPPASQVTVARPIARDVTTYSEFTGHTAALEAVDVRARVQGYLQSMHFEPGSDVEKGALLFVIEPDLYQARVDQAEAELQGKEAQSRAAEAQLEISQAIFQRSAGSRTDVVQKTQARDLAKAEVAQARATLEAAKLDLAYTHIFAPISGRIDRNLVDVGNLVGQGQATLLASIVRYDPIYAYFNASERDLLRYRELQRQNRTVAPEGQRNVAYLSLATEEGFPHPGRVDYSGNKIDPQTGTIEIRAIFANPDRIILPGLFARIRLPFTREPSLLVPDLCVQMDQGGAYVLVVDDKNVVQYRRVTTGATVEGHQVVVRTGLRPNDWVVVNGLQRARPGTTVQLQRQTLESAVPTAAAEAQTPAAAATPAVGAVPATAETPPAPVAETPLSPTAAPPPESTAAADSTAAGCEAAAQGGPGCTETPPAPAATHGE